jgi:processive 1,2-diacylglycerol beta-glucosyltransferase
MGETSTNRKKTIWILYCSRKGGHTYPVKALDTYITENYNSNFSTKVINLLDILPTASLIEKLGRYGDLKFRRTWRYGYKNLQAENPVFLEIWRWVQGLLFNLDGLHKKLSTLAGKPDLIVSIQPEVNVLSPFFKKWYSVPIHTIIIDLAVHGLWLDKMIDHYYVFNSILSSELQKRGINLSHITVSGVPLRPSFSNIVKKDPKVIREKLGISDELPTLLLLGGLLGAMVDFNQVIQSIIDLDLPLQLLVIYGKNEKSREKFSQMRQNSKTVIYPYGIVSNMDEMMWAADLVISKPGSVTMAESLALDKPMLVILPEAGSFQEFRFAQFLQENGAGRWIEKPDAAGPAVKEILFTPNLYQTMKANAQKLGRQSLTANNTIMENLIKSLN